MSMTRINTPRLTERSDLGCWHPRSDEGAAAVRAQRRHETGRRETRSATAQRLDPRTDQVDAQLIYAVRGERWHLGCVAAAAHTLK
jgi:hypothetical protein